MKKTILMQTEHLAPETDGALRRAAERILRMRGVTLAREATGREDYEITVHVDSSLRNDRYLIRAERGRATARAASPCAAFAAVGKLLRLIRFDGEGSFTPPAEGTEVDFTPRDPIRGMYFATHFYNFYHSAPLERVYDIIEDLALRGANSLLVWFDMHHYTSMQDPAAQAQTARLRAILGYANTVGMGGALTMLSNEAFAGSPPHLRAEWAAQNGYHSSPDSHYHVEICPSKPGGIEEILRARREMLEAFRDLTIDYVIYWPYDQGGCTCAKCAPWGAVGFPKLLPHFKALIRELMPHTRVIVSAWYFDRFTDGEWSRFLPLTEGEAFADVPYLMSFFFEGKAPTCVLDWAQSPRAIPQIDFPEISMYSCTPWGGYGASLLTSFLETTNRATAHLYHGGYPYSEGIFEDANKFIALSRYTGEFPHAADALREYVRHEFCCDDEALLDAVRRTETALARKRSRTAEGIHVAIQNASDIEFVWKTFQKYNDSLPSSVTSAPKFRLFYLRALIDYELMTHDGYAIRSAAAQSAMREINALYYADERTNPWVKAPVDL